MKESKRRAEAERARRAARLQALQAAKAPHYALIVDQSQRGRYAMEKFLGAALPGVADALRQKIQAFGAVKPKYTCFLGTHRYTGGTTAFAMDERDLLEGVLPTFLHRVAEKGGLCSFIVATAPEIEDRLLETLAAMQSGYDEYGRYVIPEKLAKALASVEEEKKRLLPALHDGAPVSLLEVALDNGPAMKVAELFSRVVAAWHASEFPERVTALSPLPAERMPNGHLVVTGIFPDDSIETIDVEWDEWRFTSENVQRMREQDASQTGFAMPSEGEPMDFHTLEIPDERHFTIVGRLVAGLVRGKAPGTTTQEDLEALPLRAFRLFDGSLRVTAEYGPNDVRSATVPPGAWKVIDPFAEASERYATTLLDQPWPTSIRGIDISRDVIEGKHTRLFAGLASRLRKAPDGPRFGGSLVFAVNGYGDDPRALCEIPEVTTFFRQLASEWPELPFFLHQSIEDWLLYFSLVCEGSRGLQTQPVTIDSGIETVPLSICLEAFQKEMERALEAIDEMVVSWDRKAMDRAAVVMQGMAKITAGIMESVAPGGTAAN